MSYEPTIDKILNGGTGEVDTEMALYYLVSKEKARKKLKKAKFTEFEEAYEELVERCHEKAEVDRERLINRFVVLMHQLKKEHEIDFSDIADDDMEKEVFDLVKERIFLFDKYILMYEIHLGEFFTKFIDKFHKDCDKPHQVYALAGMFYQAIGTMMYGENNTPEDILPYFYCRVHLNLNHQGAVVYGMLLNFLSNKSYVDDVTEEVNDFFAELMEMYSDPLGGNFDNWVKKGARAFLRRCGTTREDLVEEIYELVRKEQITKEMIEEVFEYHGRVDQAPDEFSQISFPTGLNGPAIRTNKKVYPNDPCPCGSGKKYKKCCGHDYGIKDKDENN